MDLPANLCHNCQDFDAAMLQIVARYNFWPYAIDDPIEAHASGNAGRGLSERAANTTAQPGASRDVEMDRNAATRDPAARHPQGLPTHRQRAGTILERRVGVRELS